MTSSSASFRVLLAEDDESARALLSDLLTALGHSVVATVATGREAVARVAEVAPDVVLLDVHMPDGSGIDAARQITAASPGTAVVLFTGDVTVGLSDEEARTTGAHAVLPKPSPPSLIDSTLRLAVERVRERAEARGDAARAKGDAERARQMLEDRKLIERAKGILMRRTGCTEQEAWRILQRSSQDRSVPMVDIARAVLESEQRGT